MLLGSFANHSSASALAHRYRSPAARGSGTSQRVGAFWSTGGATIGPHEVVESHAGRRISHANNVTRGCRPLFAPTLTEIDGIRDPQGRRPIPHTAVRAERRPVHGLVAGSAGPGGVRSARCVTDESRAGTPRKWPFGQCWRVGYPLAWWFCTSSPDRSDNVTGATELGVRSAARATSSFSVSKQMRLSLLNRSVAVGSREVRCDNYSEQLSA